MNQFVVITTIHAKSDAIAAFEEHPAWLTVVVGDKKSVPIPSSATLKFLAVEEQLASEFRLARQCPFHHYARKNIGYLDAIHGGAEVIFDTDDDNFPRPEWALPAFRCEHGLVSQAKYVNIYSRFTDEFVWPRGFPLDEIRNAGQSPLRIERSAAVDIGVWQGLTNGEPDVDALFRLIVNRPVRFSRAGEFYLPPWRFSPINSQNSFWQRRAFPYLYLPATVSFRFTDILRGYVAQRLLWQDGLHVGVTPATVRQCRNPHDLMSDFADEVPMFLHIKEIVAILESAALGSDPWDNLFVIYDRLAAARFVGREEMELLQLWREAFLQMKR